MDSLRALVADSISEDNCDKLVHHLQLHLDDGLVGSRLASNFTDVIIATTRSSALVLEPTYDKARAIADPSNTNSFVKIWIQQALNDGTLGAMLKKLSSQPQILSAYAKGSPVRDRQHINALASLLDTCKGTVPPPGTAQQSSTSSTISAPSDAPSITQQPQQTQIHIETEEDALRQRSINSTSSLRARMQTLVSAASKSSPLPILSSTSSASASSADANPGDQGTTSTANISSISSPTKQHMFSSQYQHLAAATASLAGILPPSISSYVGSITQQYSKVPASDSTRCQHVLLNVQLCSDDVHDADGVRASGKLVSVALVPATVAGECSICGLQSAADTAVHQHQQLHKHLLGAAGAGLMSQVNSLSSYLTRTPSNVKVHNHRSTPASAAADSSQQQPAAVHISSTDANHQQPATAAPTEQATPTTAPATGTTTAPATARWPLGSMLGRLATARRSSAADSASTSAATTPCATPQQQQPPAAAAPLNEKELQLQLQGRQLGSEIRRTVVRVFDQAAALTGLLGDECEPLVSLCSQVEVMMAHGLQSRSEAGSGSSSSWGIRGWFQQQGPSPWSTLKAADAKLGSISAKLDLGSSDVERMQLAKGASDGSKLQMWIRISLNSQCLGSRLVSLTRDLQYLSQHYSPGALLQQPDALVELVSMVKGLDALRFLLSISPEAQNAAQARHRSRQQQAAPALDITQFDWGTSPFMGAALVVRSAAEEQQGERPDGALTPESSAVLSPLAGSDAEGADFWSPRELPRRRSHSR